MKNYNNSHLEPQVEVPDYQLRPATYGDFPFTLELYVSSMKPLLRALDAWDAEKAEVAFRGYFIPDEIKIVQLDGKDIGWLQVSISEKELCLDQVHLLEEARGKGIGTCLINSVIDAATKQGRDVSLSLIKGNPSLELYKKLGFGLVGEDDTKFHMRRCSATNAPSPMK